VRNVQGDNVTAPPDTAGRRDSWLVEALLAVGAWLVISPLVLSTTRVTAGVISAVGGGLAVAVLAGWALGVRNRVPPLAIACFFGLWLVLAPTLWEFGDGVDSGPGLVPIAPSDMTEPAPAVVARAEWNSILAGLVILVLAGSALLAGRRRQGRSAPTAGGEHPPNLSGNRRRRRGALPGRTPAGAVCATSGGTPGTCCGCCSAAWWWRRAGWPPVTATCSPSTPTCSGWSTSCPMPWAKCCWW
jgi:hypothetical protein